MYAIRKRSSLPETYNSFLTAASKCQSHLSAIAEKGSLSERYCLVLEELRVETLRQTQMMPTTTSENVNDDMHARAVSGSNFTDPLQYINTTGEFHSLDIAMSPLSNPVDWEEFASMIDSGLGNLDTFFSESLI